MRITAVHAVLDLLAVDGYKGIITGAIFHSIKRAEAKQAVKAFIFPLIMAREKFTAFIFKKLM